jgi:hypothetical protein
MTLSQVWMRIKDWIHGKPTVTVDREMPRSDRWPTVRKHHLDEEPKCQWCGGTKNLEVHHIMAFHLDPAKELDDGNLITLCENPKENCHLKHGHPVIQGGQVVGYNFRTGLNPNVRADCVAHNKPKEPMPPSAPAKT